MAKEKMTKGQTTIYKITTRKLKIEQQEPYLKPGVSVGAPAKFQMQQ